MRDSRQSLVGLFFTKEAVFFIVIFVTSFSLLMINDGIFWDTWVLYNQPLEVLIDTFTQAGAPWTAYYHYITLDYFGVQGSRFIMCLAYLVSGLFLNEILKKLGCIKRYDRTIIVAFFLIIPLNFARISAINFPASICYSAFFAALYFFIEQLNKKSYAALPFRILALLAFYFSFMLNSVLVLYAIVPMVFMYWSHLQGASAQTSAKEGLKYIDFWVLPIVFYGVKICFFTPSGLYEGYNAVTFQAVVSSFEYTPSYLINVWKTLFDLQLSYGAFTFFGIFFVGLSFFLRTVVNKDLGIDRKDGSIQLLFYMLFISLVCLYLAAFPYVVVSKTLNFLDWESRDQLLLPLGFSFLLFVLVRFVAKFFGEKVSCILAAAILSLFIVKNGVVYYSYLLDNIKQQALIVEFKSNDVIRKGASFLVVDKTVNFNALSRVYRFYEWTGMMREAFANQKHFVVSADRYKDSEYYKKFTKNSSCNIEGHALGSPEGTVIIGFKGFKENYQKTLDSLVLAYIFDEYEFEVLKHQLLDVRVVGL